MFIVGGFADSLFVKLVSDFLFGNSRVTMLFPFRYDVEYRTFRNVEFLSNGLGGDIILEPQPDYFLLIILC